MGYSFFNRILGIVSVAVFCFSCTNDVDFNQVDEFNAQPVYTTNLAYFDLIASDFIVNGTEQSVFSHVAVLDLFNSSFFDENLVGADLFFKVNNTINRAYVLNMTFFDNQNQPLYNVNLSVPSYTGTDDTVTKTVVFDTTNLDVLKNSTKINFVLIMLPGPPLTANSTGHIKLSSSVTAYLDIK
ncbi:hypothetical protein [Flavobacterium sp. N3904]|uniref:hypothetical protein n=1 Tax=Flavobacterium sp. N3904 TaxID=2986835 RepID=UPI002224BD73|nr:hypothetical protein [Flavobacterium sp. N3904]